MTRDDAETLHVSVSVSLSGFAQDLRAIRAALALRAATRPGFTSGLSALGEIAVYNFKRPSRTLQRMNLELRHHERMASQVALKIYALRIARK